ncbi:MAG: PhzF family phenazine biosynthesis protein [Kastovskya adunca ATA6-11-RM4]|nr:PhzF family phenazine biosynthesis protein [Kastovskya adunca ATA6-11-RM4]
MEFKHYRFYTADIFTDRVFGGNQLAVLIDAQGLSTEQMQQIAREFNLSETAFVLPAQTPGHDRRLRIFTPRVELPFAGHPTVGTAYVLAATGEISLTGEETTIVLEEEVGAIAVKIRAEGGKPVYSELSAAKMPEFGAAPPSIEALAAVLSLETTDFLADGEVQAVSCGVPFLFVPLRDRSVLQRVQLNREKWQQVLADYWAPHVYVFTDDTELRGSNVRSRMFAPALGVDEDPATGAAATALAGYLGSRRDETNGTLRWVVEQGWEMGRPSLLQVEADKQDGDIVAIRVGGSSVLVSQGAIAVPFS